MRMAVEADNDAFALLFATLNRTLEDLGACVEASIASVDPSPVLLTRPTSARNHLAESLEHASLRLQAMAQEYRSAERRIVRALTALDRQIHNCQLALSPISSLPPEILLRIFHLAIRRSHPDVPWPESPIELAQTCSQWRRLIRGQRELWSSFALCTPISRGRLREHLSFSSGNPLHVFIGDSLFMGPLEGHLPLELWSERLQTLNWESARSATRALVRGGTFSHLQSLTISHSSNCGLCGRNTKRRSPRTINSVVELPVLQTLSLRTLDTNTIPVMNTPSLTRLNLCDVYTSRPHLRALLESSTVLETLKFEKLDIRDLRRNDPSNITLPGLHSLSTSNIDPPELRYLVTRLNCPALRRWECFNSPYIHDPSDPLRLAALVTQFIRLRPWLEQLSFHSSLTHILQLLGAVLPDDHIETANPDTNQLDPSLLVDPSLHALRKVELKLAFWTEEEEEEEDDEDEHSEEGRHKEQEGALMDAVSNALTLRHRKGLPALEELVLHICEPHPPGRFASLETMVGSLVWDRCVYYDFTYT